MNNAKKFRPNTEMEFMDAKRANHPGLICSCSECCAAFSSNNVKTTEGWRETQITGLCETCFGLLCEEDTVIVTPIEKVAEALKLDVANMLVGTILVPEQCLELHMTEGEEDVWYQVTVTKVEEYGEDNDS